MDRLISSSSLSTAASPVRRKSLSEQHHELTEQLIRLKFEIAEQKGKHGELQLDWQKLNSEKHTLHTKLVDTEKECESIRKETDWIRKEQTKTRQRLDELIAETAPERKAADDAQAEHNSIQIELDKTKEEFGKVKAAGEELHKTIEELKEHAAEISSERVKISAESDGVKNEVESLQKDILEMKSNIQKIKEKSEHYEEDLVQARKESEVLAKQNDAWEAKIASREEYYLAKHHKK